MILLQYLITINDRSAFLQAKAKSIKGEIGIHEHCREMFSFSGDLGNLSVSVWQHC